MVAEAKTIEPRRWTYSELLTLDDERRVELYDGDLVEMTAPKLKHQKVLQRLSFLLEAFAREHSAGTIYLAPHDLYISETKFFEPDLSFVAAPRFLQERIEREDGACLVAPPDLIVEILSESTGRNDRVLKFNAYAAFGVRYYWIIDPDARTLHAHVLENGRYAVEFALTAADTFAPSLFPGLQIPLHTLFDV